MELKELEMPKLLEQWPINTATHAQLAEIISLRDYMAMAALPSILDYGIPTLSGKLNGNIVMAKAAYEIADAMLRTREAKNETKT